MKKIIFTGKGGVGKNDDSFHPRQAHVRDFLRRF